MTRLFLALLTLFFLSGSAIGENSDFRRCTIAVKVPDPWTRTPATLQDQMTLNAAKNGAGTKIIDNLGDANFKGMEKWEYKVKSSNGLDSVVHYVRDPATDELMDFKFKKNSADGMGKWQSTPDPKVGPSDPPSWW